MYSLFLAPQLPENYLSLQDSFVYVWNTVKSRKITKKDHKIFRYIYVAPADSVDIYDIRSFIELAKVRILFCSVVKILQIVVAHEQWIIPFTADHVVWNDCSHSFCDICKPPQHIVFDKSVNHYSN